MMLNLAGICHSPLMLGRYPAAESDLRQVAEQRPGDASNYFALGEALRLQGKNREALAAYDRALKLRPNFESARQMRQALGNPG